MISQVSLRWHGMHKEIQGDEMHSGHCSPLERIASIPCLVLDAQHWNVNANFPTRSSFQARSLLSQTHELHTGAIQQRPALDRWFTGGSWWAQFNQSLLIILSFESFPKEVVTSIQGGCIYKPSCSSHKSEARGQQECKPQWVEYILEYIIVSNFDSCTGIAIEPSNDGQLAKCFISPLVLSASGLEEVKTTNQGHHIVWETF